MEVVHGLDGTKGLDLIIHSPGGSAEATEAFVNYLRTKFDDIRSIIPQAAMSAATMLACAANRIVMGKHSSIGPIDPQMMLSTPLGMMSVPAYAIIEQFEMAQKEFVEPQKRGVWMPILQFYGPALLIQCKNAIELSKILVENWLEKYMFNGDSNAKELESIISNKLSKHSEHKSHGRHINRNEARSMNLKIENLEDSQITQDLVLSVFHSVTHTFANSSAVKIIENNLGKAFIKQQAPQQIPVSIPIPILPAKK
jgi:hypothetical protein